MKLQQRVKGFGGKAGPITKALYTGEITSLPGCPDVAVSHALFHSDGEGGHGVDANWLRQRQLREMGYSAVMCTVDSENVKQRAILKKTGWTEGAKFYNRRTQHTVIFYMKSLEDT